MNNPFWIEAIPLDKCMHRCDREFEIENSNDFFVQFIAKCFACLALNAVFCCLNTCFYLKTDFKQRKTIKSEKLIKGLCARHLTINYTTCVQDIHFLLYCSFIRTPMREWILHDMYSF